MRYGCHVAGAFLASLSLTPACLPLGILLPAGLRASALAAGDPERAGPGGRRAILRAVSVPPIALTAYLDDALAFEALKHPVETPFGRRRSAESHPASATVALRQEPEPQAALRRTESETEQTAGIRRILAAVYKGLLRDQRFLILDRDTKFTAQFRRILGDAGVAAVPTAFRAPNMNALAERLVQSIKRECLERLILFGSDDLQRALQEFVAHHHLVRPHQGLGPRVLTASTSVSPKDGEVVVDERLGGLLRSYRRTAWRRFASRSSASPLRSGPPGCSLGANTLPRFGYRWGWSYGASNSCTKRLGGISG